MNFFADMVNVANIKVSSSNDLDFIKKKINK